MPTAASEEGLDHHSQKLTCVYMYLPTPPKEQDATQGQFLSGVEPI